MATHVALLRAVNVGGTGKLAMSELRRLCEDCGFGNVRTYIASGNVVLDADRDPKADLEFALLAHVGRRVEVLTRSAAEMAAVLAADPFPDRPPNLVHVVFLDHAPPGDPLAGASGLAGEAVASGRREIYVHYPMGQGASKLKLSAARLGTARNLNTVAKLAEMAGVRPV